MPGAGICEIRKVRCAGSWVLGPTLPFPQWHRVLYRTVGQLKKARRLQWHLTRHTACLSKRRDFLTINVVSSD